MLVSNEFVKDPQCQRMLNYAKDSLKKELLVLMVGKGREWQQSNIGMTLSEKVYINFQRIEQYEDKLVELSRRLKELTTGQQVSYLLIIIIQFLQVLDFAKVNILCFTFT